MLENCQNAQERWGGVNEIIDQWLKQRQQLLSLFCRLNNATPSKLQRFCQVLVDYVSAGHFEVYGQLVREAREFKDEGGLQEASGLFSVIDRTTETALAFNDKYSKTADLSEFTSDMSRLGESLGSRLEAEDKMIAVLHDSHRTEARMA